LWQGIHASFWPITVIPLDNKQIILNYTKAFTLSLKNYHLKTACKRFSESYANFKSFISLEIDCLHSMTKLSGWLRR
jgi:hypothetical protein